MAVFDATTFGVRFKVDFANDDPVAKLGQLIARLKTVGIDSAGTQKILSQFFATLAGEATMLNKPLNDVAATFEKLRDTMKATGTLTKGAQDAATRAARAQILGNQHAASTDPLREALFADYQEGNSKFNPPGSGPAWLRGTQNIARMISYVDQLRRAMVGFVEQNAKASRELYMMAQQAQASIEEIAKLGGALEAFGGRNGKAADERRQFEVEMAKMQRGEGVGGKYIDVARLYGIKFHPNDFAAQQMEWAKFLSDPTRSRTDKAGFINMMGFDASQVALYSRGPDFVKREQALQAELSSNSKKAAEATVEYTRSMQHLSAAWENLKNGALAPLLEILTPIIEGLSTLFKTINQIPVIRKIVGILMLFFGALVAVAMPIAKVAALFRMAGVESMKASPKLQGLINKIKNLGATATTSGGKTTTGIGGLAKGMVLVEAIMGLMGGLYSHAKGDHADGNKTIGMGIGSALGTWGGAKLGAIIGTFIAPGVGTAIGGLLGTIIGAFAGGSLGSVGADAINRSMGVRDRDDGAQEVTTREINESVEQINRNAAMMVNSYSKNGGDTNYSRFEIAHVEVKVEGNGADPVAIANAVPGAMRNELRNVAVDMAPKGVA